MSLSFLTPVPGRIQSFFNIIADSFETFEMGLTQSPSTSTVQTQTFSGSNLQDWSFVAKMSRHFKESSLFFGHTIFSKTKISPKRCLLRTIFCYEQVWGLRLGAMGSTSLFERLEACLAEERAELETWRWIRQSSVKTLEIFHFLLVMRTIRLEGILKQSLRKSDMACSSRTTSLHWNSFYWKYVLFFLIRFALASQGFALLAWAISQQELMADPHFAGHDMPRFSVWENCTEISSKAAFRKSSCQGCGSRSPMRFLCLSTGRRPACNMFSQSS